MITFTNLVHYCWLLHDWWHDTLAFKVSVECWVWIARTCESSWDSVDIDQEPEEAAHPDCWERPRRQPLLTLFWKYLTLRRCKKYLTWRRCKNIFVCTLVTARHSWVCWDWHCWWTWSCCLQRIVWNIILCQWVKNISLLPGQTWARSGPSSWDTRTWSRNKHTVTLFLDENIHFIFKIKL